MLMQQKLISVVFISKNKDSLPFRPKIIPHLKSKYDNTNIPCFKEEYTGYEIFY